MIAVDPNWERWIAASLFKFVKTEADTLGFHTFIEGQEQRKTSEHRGYLEMRFDGPFFKLEQSFYRISVQLNILISQQKDRHLYKTNDVSGDVVRIMANYVPVFKLGDGPGDDGSQIGCLRVDDKTGIVAHKYGQIQPATNLVQATVEATYWIDLPG